MPAFQIVETTVSDKLPELLPLFERHRKELEPWSSAVSPNLEAYRALERSGTLLALVAFMDDHGCEGRLGKIIGYSINFIGQHMHYADMIYCHNDMLFVDPAHRGGKFGLELITRTERAAEERGAEMVVWHAKPGTALEKLLPRLGYEVHEVSFSKECQ